METSTKLIIGAAVAAGAYWYFYMRKPATTGTPVMGTKATGSTQLNPGQAQSGTQQLGAAASLFDPGMPPATVAVVQNELATDNDPVSLQNLAQTMAAKGYTIAANALSAKATAIQTAAAAGDVLTPALARVLSAQSTVSTTSGPLTIRINHG